MAPAGRKSVVLISAFDAPFIAEDADILASGRYDVTRLTGSGPAALGRAVLSGLTTDVVFCWFLSVYGAAALLAGSLPGRRSVLVLGGVDTARDRDLGYGLWLSPWKSFLARRALRRADRVLVVSPNLRDEVVRLAGYPGDNITVLPTGYDADFWTPAPQSDRSSRRGVLCVAAADETVRLRVKGVDILTRAAGLMPDVPFTVVGVDPALARSLGAPPNVGFVPRVERSGLLHHYREAKVYCQPSRREGLPNALCEAMLCGCIPVGTGVGAIPEAVGETGFIAGSGDPGEIAAAIGRALSASDDLGASARERIARLFPAGKRRSELLRIMKELSDE